MIDLLESRRSVRSYDEIPIQEGIVNKLKSEVTFINSHEAGLNFQIFFDDDSPFRGFRRSYGMFRNVRNYLCAVIDPTFPDTYERAGYFAEQFVMEAVKLGLGTCFVGGTFSRENIQARVEVYEKVPFVVAFGYPDEAHSSLLSRVAYRAVHRKKKSVRDFFSGTDAEYKDALSEFNWLETALRAVACAPSAYNRQPVRLSVSEIEGRRHIVATTVEPSKDAVELGIAKFNVADAVGGIWNWGEGAPFENI